jgi:hypothetical protein
MGLMDKVKKASEQAVAKAQVGVKEGRAKLDEVQAKRQWDALLRNLGAAVYAEQRQGGTSGAVAAAFQSLDEHAAAHGAGATHAEPTEGPGQSPGQGADQGSGQGPDQGSDQGPGVSSSPGSSPD